MLSLVFKSFEELAIHEERNSDKLTPGHLTQEMVFQKKIGWDTKQNEVPRVRS